VYAADEGRVSERAFSTLKILCEVEKPVKVLVVVLDTLAVYEGASRAESYDDVERNARNYAGRYLCGVKAEIVVLPGIYKLYDEKGERASFESDPRSEFLPLFTYTVFKKAVEADATSIALDVSHGMNFMPTLALRASEEAAAALAAARVERVKLRVYQSDPYPPGFRELERAGNSGEDVCRPKQSGVKPPSLHYNLILEKAFEPWDLTRYISYEKQHALRVLTDDRGCDFDGVRNLLRTWALPLLGAFRLGALPQLALLAKAAPLDELKGATKGAIGAADRAIDCWRRKRDVRGGDTLRVASRTRFAPGFLALIHARAVLEGARKLLELCEGSIPLEEAAVRFDELNSLKMLVKGSEVVSVLVDREISKLDYYIWEKQGWKFLSSEWVGYDELLRKMYGEKSCELADLLEEQESGSGKSKNDKSKFKRDFIAHAGFHTGVLELRLAGEKLEIRVKSDQWERVSEVLREVTREGEA